MTEVVLQHPAVARNRIRTRDRLILITAPGHGKHRIEDQVKRLQDDNLALKTRAEDAEEGRRILEEKVVALTRQLDVARSMNKTLTERLEAAKSTTPEDSVERAESEAETTLTIPVVGTKDGVVRHLSVLIPK